MNKTNTENRHVQILSTGIRLEGTVNIPEEPKGFVLFVHGSGSRLVNG
jgi:predicted RNA-binding protein with TRAM domain